MIATAHFKSQKSRQSQIGEITPALCTCLLHANESWKRLPYLSGFVFESQAARQIFNLLETQDKLPPLTHVCFVSPTCSHKVRRALTLGKHSLPICGIIRLGSFLSAASLLLPAAWGCSGTSVSCRWLGQGEKWEMSLHCTEAEIQVGFSALHRNKSQPLVEV